MNINCIDAARWGQINFVTNVYCTVENACRWASFRGAGLYTSKMSFYNKKKQNERKWTWNLKIATIFFKDVLL